jgi:class 3 adenylate cyclase
MVMTTLGGACRKQTAAQTAGKLCGGVGVIYSARLLHGLPTTQWDWLAGVLLQVTLLFSDIVGFTEISSEWRTELVVTMLDMLFSSFDELCSK